MSYATDSAAIKLILTNAGYEELENNLDLENEPIAKLIDKGFTLKAREIEPKYMTNKKQLNSVISELTISYYIKSNSDYDAALDLFKSAINALSTTHYGFESRPTFKRHTSNVNYAFGKAVLYIGVEQC